MQALETEGNETAKEEIKKVQYEQHTTNSKASCYLIPRKKDSILPTEHTPCHSMLHTESNIVGKSVTFSHMFTGQMTFLTRIPNPGIS